MALGANLYFRKPTDLKSFMELGQIVEDTLHLASPEDLGAAK